MTITPFQALRAVRLNRNCPDASLDLEAMDVDTYKKTRDPDLVKLLPDTKADWFTITKLPALWLASINSTALNTEARCILAFRATCHSIERSDGSVLAPEDFEKPITLPGTTVKVRAANGDWFNTVCDEFGYDTVLELGSIALTLAGLPKGAYGPFTSWVGMVQKH